MILQNSYCITGLDMKTAGRILGVPVSDKGVLEQSWPDCLEEVEVEPKLKLLIMVCTAKNRVEHFHQNWRIFYVTNSTLVKVEIFHLLRGIAFHSFTADFISLFRWNLFTNFGENLFY